MMFLVHTVQGKGVVGSKNHDLETGVHVPWHTYTNFAKFISFQTNIVQKPPPVHWFHLPFHISPEPPFIKEMLSVTHPVNNGALSGW